FARQTARSTAPSTFSGQRQEHRHTPRALVPESRKACGPGSDGAREGLLLHSSHGRLKRQGDEERAPLTNTAFGPDLAPVSFHDQLCAVQAEAIALLPRSGALCSVVALENPCQLARLNTGAFVAH